VLPEQAGSGPAASVQTTLAPGAALFIHAVGRAGAEAALTAAVGAAAGPSTAVRHLVRPKGTVHVLSLFVPSQQKFHHKHVTAGSPGGEFAIGTITSLSLAGVCGKVAEAMAANSGGAAGSVPVLRGAGRATAEELSQ